MTIENDHEQHRDDKGAYLPTADEIAAGCRFIQSRWTPREEATRRGVLQRDETGWTPPQVKVSTDE